MSLHFTTRGLGVCAIVGAVIGSACTVDQTAVPPLTGPSTFATSVSVAADPDIVNLGPSANRSGQQAQIIVTVFDATGQPKANQNLRLETVVNGQPSPCGTLSSSTLATGSDGRAVAIFTAPGTPPNCPNFNVDGTVTIRATPVGSQASSAAASGTDIFLALPAQNDASGPLEAKFSIARLTGNRFFQFDGSSSLSPGHTIDSYVWTFSDGHRETSRVIDHDFGSQGTYLVTLTVTDNIGQSSFKTALVTAN